MECLSDGLAACAAKLADVLLIARRQLANVGVGGILRNSALISRSRPCALNQQATEGRYGAPQRDERTTEYQKGT